MNDPNYVDPNLSPDTQKFILAARTLLYKMGDHLKQAITGAHNLADGVATLLVQLVSNLESRMGELQPPDLEKVFVHLAGPVVDIAKREGDPDAQNTQQAVTEIVGKAMEMMANQEGQEGQSDPDQDQGQDMQQGAPQGPPQPQGLMYGG
jgi:hypothetical protein